MNLCLSSRCVVVVVVVVVMMVLLLVDWAMFVAWRFGLKHR